MENTEYAPIVEFDNVPLSYYPLVADLVKGMEKEDVGEQAMAIKARFSDITLVVEKSDENYYIAFMEGNV